MNFDKFRINIYHIIIIFVLITSILFSQNKWERLSSISGGNVRAILIQDDGNIFIGTDYGGLYRFSKNIDAWVLVNDSLKNNNIRFIGEDFIGSLYLASWGTGGLIRSSNEGSSWHSTSITSSIYCFKKDNLNQQLISGSNGIVYISTDNGVNWAIDTVTKSTDYILSIDVDENGIVYASSSDGIFKRISKNNWNRIDQSFENSYVPRLRIHNNILYCVVRVGSNNNIIYKSTDYGQSWNLLYRFAMLNQTNYIEEIEFDSSGNMYAGLSYNGIYKSPNGGQGFSKLTNFIFMSVNFIKFEALNNTLYVGTDGGGFFYSNDQGNSWHSNNTNIHNVRISDIAVGKEDQIFIGSIWYQGLIHSSNNYGVSWSGTNIGAADWGDLNGLQTDKLGNVYVAVNNRVYKYNFGQKQFDPIQYFEGLNNISTDGKESIYIITDYKMYQLTNSGTVLRELVSKPFSNSIYGKTYSDSEGRLFLAYHQNVNGNLKTMCFMSPDTGRTWGQLLELEHTSIEGIVIDSSDNIYMACSNFTGLLKSTDHGQTWSEIIQYSVYDILIDSLNNIYITTGYDIRKSSNGGTSWQTLTHFSDQKFYTKLAITQRGNLIASVDHDGLYKYLDVSYPVVIKDLQCILSDNLVTLSWSTEDDCKNLGFEVERLKDSSNWSTIAFVSGNQNDSAIFKHYSISDTLNFEGNYSYRLKQISTDSRISYSEKIETQYIIQVFSFELKQNFPNPFNSSTIIKYVVETESKIELTVYDLLGRLVKILVRESQKPGNYEVNFDGKDLATGVYFYNLRYGNYQATKKMLMIK
ncbi:MAG: T9SS type A sorting domain-containing protein [Ignavibacteriales bacterium]|nr:MAG: T9SS type A sorting domain-containing protein [Ignavibacteriales bacterium]